MPYADPFEFIQQPGRCRLFKDVQRQNTEATMCPGFSFFFFLLLVLCTTNKKCTFRPQAAVAVWPCCSEISGGSACSSNPETLNNCSQNSAPHHLPNPNLPRALIHNTPSTLSTIILFSSQHWSFFPPQQQVKCELLLLLVEVVG